MDTERYHGESAIARAERAGETERYRMREDKAEKGKEEKPSGGRWGQGRRGS